MSMPSISITRCFDAGAVVYLLMSSMARRTYIGCAWQSPAPWRRCAQHNGVESGGVERLASGRPWHVACFVHGFTNHLVALQFEAAWQRGFRHASMRYVSRFTPSRGALGKVELLIALLKTPAWWPLRLRVHVVHSVPLVDQHERVRVERWLFALRSFSYVTRGPHW